MAHELLSFRGMSSLSDRLGEHPLFAPLPEKDRATLAKAARLLRFRPPEVVFRTGDESDGVRVLLTGSVRVFHTSPDGAEAAVKLFKAPGIFGEIEVIASVPFGEDVAALEESEIVVIPRQDFLAHLDLLPALTRSLLTHVCACFCVAAHTEAAMSFEDVRARLAHLLLSYAQLYGTPADKAGAVHLDLPLTQDDMANALGVTRRAVAKEMARWKQDRVVERHAGSYVIRRPGVLLEESPQGRYSIGYVLGHGPTSAH